MQQSINYNFFSPSCNSFTTNNLNKNDILKSIRDLIVNFFKQCSMGIDRLNDFYLPGVKFTTRIIKDDNRTYHETIGFNNWKNVMASISIKSIKFINGFVDLQIGPNDFVLVNYHAKVQIGIFTCRIFSSNIIIINGNSIQISNQILEIFV